MNHASQSKSTDGSTSGWRQRSVVVVVIVVAIYLSCDLIVVGVVVILQ